jgi:bud emergence protein 1
VPVAFFEVIGKTQRQSADSKKSIGDKQENHDSGFSEKGTGGVNGRSEQMVTNKSSAHGRMSSVSKGSSAMVYGIVQYDFNAERPDELEAKAGEAIIVIAQSTPEWFVAKPIGRLGGPGLIPVSFIEVKDMATGQTVADPQEAVRRAGVPKVEEWKKMAADYKNSSISLGKLESAQQQVTSDMGRMSVSNTGSQQPPQSSNGYVSSFRSAAASEDANRNLQGQQMNQQRSGRGSAQQQPQPYRSSQQQQQQQQQQQPRLLAPISASLPRYCFDNDMYWYIIECEMEDGRHWELSRYYADFYDFQIALLEHFPEEAGNKGKPRTLPFMPGPVAHVTDAISNGRRQSLDEYIRKILSMPPHISKCQLVRQLFAPRPGDFEIDPNALGDEYRLSGASQQSSQNEASYSASRQSSNSQVNGAGGYGGMYPPGHPSQQRGPPVPAMGGPFLRNEASSLTQASASSSNKASNPGGAMKVKVFFQEDIIAVRVPSDIAFQQLKDKLRDRLKINEDIAIQYRDEPTNTLRDLDDDNDLETALQNNPKLTLTVSFVS